MKQCVKCGVVKDLRQYYRRVGAGDGFRSNCKQCQKESSTRWALENPDKKAVHRARWKKFNPKQYRAAIAAWQKRNKSKCLEAGKRWYRKFPDRSKLKCDRWRSNNKEHCRLRSSLYRSIARKQTPKWADKKAIANIYKNKPEGLQVDHIVPLRGKYVCGLHVEYNLQYLTPSENARKKNTFVDPRP